MPNGRVVPPPNVGIGYQLPNTPAVGVADDGQQFAPDYLSSLMTQFLSEFHDIYLRAGEEADIFDSYRPQSIGGESCSQLTILLDYELQEVQTIVVTGPTIVADSAGVAQSYQSPVGNVTDPAANAVITTTGTLPAGTYTVQTFLGYQGTVTTADNDNYQLLVGATVVGQLMADTTTSSTTQNPAAVRTITVPAGGAALSIEAIANASSASAIYRAQIIATPALPSSNGTPFTLQLGLRAWQLLLPSTGILVNRFKPGLLVKRADLNQLISATAGNWSVELTGIRSDM